MLLAPAPLWRELGNAGTLRSELVAFRDGRLEIQYVAALVGSFDTDSRDPIWRKHL